jgi:hypothetical protein
MNLLYAYVQTCYKGKDFNHAPHAGADFLSLANCKAVIREVQELDNGNWVIGLLSVRNRKRRVSYLARIDEVIDRAV